jgi:hypothetical protein
VTATDPISLDGLFLRIASVENDIYWPAPNGTNIHNQTFRNMFPYTLGQRIYIDTPGEVVEVSQDVNCPEPLDLDNCEFIVWVQSEQNKEILQTAKIPLTDFVPVGIDESADLPTGFKLYQNYPNPFNAGTVIDYVIEKETPVELSVYDLLGQKIAALVNESQGPGHYQVTWHGMDDSGRAVASGMYFYKLTADGKSSSKRMTFLK